jgi:hypothetical protein
MNQDSLQQLLASTLGTKYTPKVINDPGNATCLVSLTGPFGGTWTKLYGKQAEDLTFMEVHGDIKRGLWI